MHPFHNPMIPSVLRVSFTASPICVKLIFLDCILVLISSRGETRTAVKVRAVLPAMAGNTLSLQGQKLNLEMWTFVEKCYQSYHVPVPVVWYEV